MFHSYHLYLFYFEKSEKDDNAINIKFVFYFEKLGEADND